MNTEVIIRTQLKLECVRINQSKYMESFPCDNPDSPYRLLMIWDGETYLRFIRADVPTEIRQTLKIMPLQRLFEQRERIQALLSEHEPCNDVFIGRTYLGINTIKPPHDERVVPIISGFGILADDEVIASCTSIRENAQAAEAYVVTAEAYQRKGYAKHVTQAWLARVQADNKLAFYTHRRDNVASQNLAEALGLRWVYDMVGYS